MSANLYESIVTRNAALARFFDENHNCALMMMKVVKMIVSICDEKRWSAPHLTFEVLGPKGEDFIVIRLRNGP